MKYDEVEVYLFGEKIGTLQDDNEKIVFYYSPRFKAKGIEFSPIKLKTNHIGPYINEEYIEHYKYLPGVIKDSLPDSNGETVMNRYFESKGLNVNMVGVLHRLAFIGDRGMGALEYRPKEHDTTPSILKSVDASTLYKHNKQVFESTGTLTIDDIMNHLFDSASPVGGAKKKVLICFNPDTEELKFCNSVDTDSGFFPTLLKFDNEEVFQEDTKKEFIYMSIAKKAGIEVEDVYLLNSGKMKHYLIKRFDRKQNKKFHIATASALLHKPHIHNGVSYEELCMLTYQITKNISDVKKLIRQMCFNFIMGVTDDHAKNFSFIMDEKGTWSLSPAYDLIYGLGVGALSHKSSLNGKNKNITYDDLFSIAMKYDISEEELTDMLVEIIDAYTNNFDKLAKNVELLDATRDGIKMYIDDSIKMIIE